MEAEGVRVSDNACVKLGEAFINHLYEVAEVNAENSVLNKYYNENTPDWYDNQYSLNEFDVKDYLSYEENGKGRTVYIEINGEPYEAYIESRVSKRDNNQISYTEKVLIRKTNIWIYGATWDMIRNVAPDGYYIIALNSAENTPQGVIMLGFRSESGADAFLNEENNRAQQAAMNTAHSVFRFSGNEVQKRNVEKRKQEWATPSVIIEKKPIIKPKKKRPWWLSW